MQKGIITQFLILLIVAGGIGVGVYLVQSGNLKLFSRAADPPIVNRPEINADRIGSETGFINHVNWMKSLTPVPPDTEIKNNLLVQAKAFHDIGLRWARDNFEWRQIEKTKGNFNWDLTDLGISFYDSGDNITGILIYTPDWASSAPPNTQSEDMKKYPAADMGDWENFVQQTVSRYKNKVHYWEIWNEAETGPGFFMPKPGKSFEESYYEVYKSAYKAIKLADPTAMILTNGFGSWEISGTGPKDANSWLSGDRMINYIVQQDGPYFDILNIHIYSREDPAEEVLRARQQLKNYSQLSAKPIWVTETNPVEYLKQPGRDGNTIESVTKIMEWWLNQQLQAGADKVFWFTLLNWPSNDFITAGLISFPGYDRQPTWYKIQELFSAPTPTPVPMAAPTTAPTPTPRTTYTSAPTFIPMAEASFPPQSNVIDQPVFIPSPTPSVDLIYNPTPRTTYTSAPTFIPMAEASFPPQSNVIDQPVFIPSPTPSVDLIYNPTPRTTYTSAPTFIPMAEASFPPQSNVIDQPASDIPIVGELLYYFAEMIIKLLNL